MRKPVVARARPIEDAAGGDRHRDRQTTTGVTGNLWPGTPFYTEESASTVNVMAPATFLYEETRAEPSVHLRYTVGTGFTVIEGHQPFR